MKHVAKGSMLLSAALALASQSAPASAQHLIWANGQAYWSGPTYGRGGAYLSGGERAFNKNYYTPNGYGDPQDYTDVVYHSHRGRQLCVWRKRVLVNDYEFFHPYVLVCD